MTSFIAEVLSIGDEMTSGARLDTNSQWLSVRLSELGLQVAYHTTVGDTLAHLVEAIRIAVQRADMVVVTGGLGPTRDDLTREAIAEATGRPLSLHDDSLRHIENLFASRGREMPERNRAQAMFPSGATAISNPHGTAPGIDLIVARADGTAARLFALPGVPAEMKPMFDGPVATAVLSQQGETQVIRHDVMKFFGIGESEMEHRLGDMIARDRTPRVGITVSAATISLRITAIAATADACQGLLRDARTEILKRVGDLHFGDGEDFEQQHAVDALLRDRGHRLMVVELGYAAPMGDWFAAIGPSPVFVGGLSLGTAADLQRLYCGVRDDVQMNDSEEGNEGERLAALQTSQRQWDADWALMVDRYPDLGTGLTGAAGGGLPSAEVTIVVLSPDGQSRVSTQRIGGHPSIVHARIAKSALAWLRQCIDEFRTAR